MATRDAHNTVGVAFLSLTSNVLCAFGLTTRRPEFQILFKNSVNTINYLVMVQPVSFSPTSFPTRKRINHQCLSTKALIRSTAFFTPSGVEASRYKRPNVAGREEASFFPSSSKAIGTIRFASGSAEKNESSWCTQGAVEDALERNTRSRSDFLRACSTEFFILSPGWISDSSNHG